MGRGQKVGQPAQKYAIPAERPTVTSAFAGVFVLFFAWGFVPSMIDPLVASVESAATVVSVH